MRWGADATDKPIDLRLSGGGTRAALFSGGALLALADGRCNQGLRIRAIRSISGSSLLIASLLLAASEEKVEFDCGSSVRVLRNELERIWRLGFVNTSYRRRLVISGVISLALTVLTFWTSGRWLSADSPPPPSSLTGGVAVVFFLFFAVTILFVWQSSRPFVIRPRPRSRWSFVGLGPRWPPIALPKTMFGLVPTEAIWMGATGVEQSGLDPTWFRVVDDHEMKPQYDGPALFRGQPEPEVSHLARASAAYPLFARAVTIDGSTFADGGLVDNLALTGPVVGPVVAVDAAIERLASPSRPVRSMVSEVVANLVQVVVIAVLAIGAIVLVAQFAIRVLAAPVDLVLNLAELAVVIVGTVMVLGPLYRSVIDSLTTLRTEFGLTNKLLKIQAAFRLAELARRDVDVTHVDFEAGSIPEAVCPVHASLVATTLRSLDPEVGAAVIDLGYRRMCTELQLASDPETVAWLEQLQAEGHRLRRRWTSRIRSFSLSTGTGCTCSRKSLRARWGDHLLAKLVR